MDHGHEIEARNILLLPWSAQDWNGAVDYRWTGGQASEELSAPATRQHLTHEGSRLQVKAFLPADLLELRDELAFSDALYKRFSVQMNWLGQNENKMLFTSDLWLQIGTKWKQKKQQKWKLFRYI